MEHNLLDYFGGDELAANTWLSKYKIKEIEGEKTPDDMHQRLAAEFARKELDYQHIENEKLYTIGNKTDLSDFGRDFNNRVGKYSYSELKELYYGYFRNFGKIIPQGSIMSNLGNSYQTGSLSNCFVIGQPFDSYAGILEKDEQLAQLMKRRGGVGLDISTLRPASAKVNNSAKTSTGAASFLHRFSNTTNEVAQGGRRGALMLSIDCRHPDVSDFIRSKEDKSKVTGANISVRLRDDFMDAVKVDGDYILRFPCEIPVNHILVGVLPYNELFTLKDQETGIDVYYKKVRAKEVYESIIYHAWLTGDPGLMFLDKHWNYSPDTVYEMYRGVTTNPCGEIFMQIYDACRLLAINYFNLVQNPFTEKASFDFYNLYEIAYIQQRLADTLIDLECEYIDNIIAKIKSKKQPSYLIDRELHLWGAIKKTASNSRRTGCGFTALADTIAAMGFSYDSDEAINLAEGISKIKMQAELDCSIDMAIMRGAFKGWDHSKEYFTQGNQKRGANPFYEMIRVEFPDQFNRMSTYGRRNVSWSTVAPTGTVSLMSQTTSGIEPLFLPYYTRRKKINHSDKDVRVDFTDDEGVQWQEFPVIHPKFRDWLYASHKSLSIPRLGIISSELVNPTESEWPIEVIAEAFKHSPWYKSTANDINWKKRLEMQAAVQKYTSHSISSTINLPNEASVDDIDVIYREAYEKNLKGITVYRDGSKYGVLVNNDNIKPKIVDSCMAQERPKSLPSEVHEVVVRGQAYVVAIGLLDKKPYEVFAYVKAEIDSNPFPGRGFIITKDATSTYRLELDVDPKQEGYFNFGDIVENMSDEQKAITRLVSASLRYNVELTYIVEQLEKVDGDVTSFSKAINRVLKKYIPRDHVSLKCDECGSENILFEEGCNKCKDCGHSKCS